MKIGGHLITSLASYRKHFDFNSVWFQLDIFLRDMSPMRIPYLNEAKEDQVAQSIFYAIANPYKVKIENSSLLYFSDDDKPLEILTINDSSSIEISSLKEYELKDKVRIVLLHELANKKISDESLSQSASSPCSNGEILLCNGSTLKVVDMVSTSMRLFIKPISVDSHSSCSSIIDGYELSPGKTAYGVFSDNGFHRLLPPILQNEKYLIRLRTDSASPEMVVRDKKDGTVSHFHNVVSFCTIKDNNYIYIQNQMVYSHHDEGLAKRLKSAVGFFGTPLFLHASNELVFITMADGTITKVEL
jgi:hypothetical protein